MGKVGVSRFSRIRCMVTGAAFDSRKVNLVTVGDASMDGPQLWGLHVALRIYLQQALQHHHSWEQKAYNQGETVST